VYHKGPSKERLLKIFQAGQENMYERNLMTTLTDHHSSGTVPETLYRTRHRAKSSGFTTLLSYRGHRVVSWPASAPAVGCAGFFANIFFSLQSETKNPTYFSLSFALSDYERRTLGAPVSRIIFFASKPKKFPYFSLSFALSECKRRTLSCSHFICHLRTSRRKSSSVTSRLIFTTGAPAANKKIFVENIKG
jgi:hypothetical protein